MLMQDLDWMMHIARALDAFGDADGTREPAVSQTPQFAIDQVVRDEPGVRRIVAQRRHHTRCQLMCLSNS
jgi:hypothetical protein